MTVPPTIVGWLIVFLLYPVIVALVRRDLFLSTGSFAVAGGRTVLLSLYQCPKVIFFRTTFRVVDLVL